MSALVTVALPLYRSQRFLDVIVRNIEAIRYPNVEFVISDRHQLDPALEQLQQRYGHDSRFRFFAATDQLDWVQHFNFLLKEGRGDYSMWMGHDDSYPAHYIPDLTAALDANPQAMLAYGQVEQESLDGYLPTFPFTAPPVAPNEPWSTAVSVRLLTLWHLWFAFRGLCRRGVLVDSGLYLRPTFRNIRADICWTFGVSLKGALIYVPTCHCTKRFHRSSGGANWRFGLRQSVDACRVLRSYWRDFGPATGHAAGLWKVYAWALSQGLLPEPVARRAGRFARRWLT